MTTQPAQPEEESFRVDLISLNQARNLPALKRTGRGDQRPDPATLHRWCRDGVRGADGSRVRLESVRVGGKRMTTSIAVERFITRLNRGGPAPLAEADAVKIAHEQSEAELNAAGI